MGVEAFRKPDFRGWATKNGLKCTDGRTIMPDAFKHQDKEPVTLVYQHGHSDLNNVLGHAILTNKPEGVWAEGYFNDTPQGLTARAVVRHGDIKRLSIFANGLVERSKQVFHGTIRELSLVLAGANPGATIEEVLTHSEFGSELEVVPDAGIIHTGLEFEVTDPDADGSLADTSVAHADEDGEKTIKDVYDSFSEEQKNVVHFMIGAALEANGITTAGDSAEQSATNKDEASLAHQEGTEVTVTNAFEQNGQAAEHGSMTGEDEKHVITHDALRSMVQRGIQMGSMKSAVQEYALAHGITNLELLFPDAKLVDQTPEWDKRRTEWVSGVLNGVRSLPFSRIKTQSANIKQDEARAKGYIKGNLKKEEWFSISQRTTTPTTVYKKQALDRDDILDMSNFDVPLWMRGEMRMMLEEELARAYLVGDGREVDDEDKIKDPIGAQDGVGIRSIANDHEAYVTTVNVQINGTAGEYEKVVEDVLLASEYYKGSGVPVLYTTQRRLTRMLLEKDGFERRRYDTKAALAEAMGVADVIPVEAMIGAKTADGQDIFGIIVNLRDYAVGTDRGGAVTLFDDFDIDFNKEKWLIETRQSGALTKLKSAIRLIEVADTDTEVVPDEPTFDPETGALTIPTKTGVEYKHGDTVVNAAGSPYDVPAGQTWTITASPTAGYYFPTSEGDSWDFTADA